MEVCEELKGIDYFDKDNQYLFPIGKGDGLHGKRRVLAILYSTIFICQLPEETQKIIRADLEECARERARRI